MLDKFQQHHAQTEKKNAIEINYTVVFMYTLYLLFGVTIRTRSEK